ncbi:MAG: type VI secretion system tip protein VgrG [Acidobacteriota bacterium]|nr:MAG: type VI secretion system tip protein VgrG [Acidobacteriota bacterium]
MAEDRAKQEKRMMKVFTPLGDDYLLINKFTAVESISELFEYELELLHEEDEGEGRTPTDVDPASILGKGIAVSIEQKDGTQRIFSGMVASFSRGHRRTRFTYYFAKVVPHVWMLTQNIQSKIYQQKSVPDILQEVLSGFEVKYEIQADLKPRNYCVQYRESDFDFISRLMEEEGLYYYFEHVDGKHLMIIADTPQSHVPVPSSQSVKYGIEASDEYEFAPSISDLWIDTRLQTGKVTTWDYNFQEANNKLQKQQPSMFSVGDNQKLELYEYPGGYARKYDGIDSGGGEAPGDLREIHNDSQRTIENMMHALDSGYRVLTGTSDCSSFTAGHKFALIEHPDSNLNCDYMLTSVTHEAEQNPSYISEEEVDEPYTNSFTCVKQGQGTPRYVPPRKTDRPLIPGTQTAVVVGPSGEEIFTDKYGRIKVQFHWDRYGKVNESSSCWVRVAQLWAGNGWGSMFIPRIGMEVVVHFIEGDPDRPIVTGCVYNPLAMPAYTLPDEKTKSGIKTDSSTGGGGFNELRFEDLSGEEQIFMHAQKNMDIRVKNDTKETVMHDRHLIVENNQLENVKRDKHLIVGGDRSESVTGTASLTAQEIHQKANQNFAVEATQGVHIKGTMSNVIESPSSVTIKCGGSSISLSPAMISISAPMVNINSGGGGGSGAGCSPNSPEEAQEADDANAGNPITKSSPGEEPPQKDYTPLAVAFKKAAHSGTPFLAV